MLAIATAPMPAFQLPASGSTVPARVTARMDVVRFEVCQNKYCKKKGSAQTLKLMQEAAEGRTDILVEAADMSHTEHGCFDECTMGPNVRVGGDGPKTDSLPFGAGKVVNGIKDAAAIEKLLANPP